jgi:2-oxoisovalerate dehydrogenase E1 component
MKLPEIPRYPSRLAEKDFYPVAYRYMYQSRTFEHRLIELFKKGYAKGTVVLSIGAEASTVGMAIPFRPGRDVMSLGHRDLGSHLALGASIRTLLCQFMANAESPTHGREGNVHFGDIAMRRMPFMSHLGAMLAPAVGGTWAARLQDPDVFGLAVIGDGGSSTGDFHETLNLASVRKVPVLFMIENNHYAFSVPTRLQYSCAKLSDRAPGYGVPGVTIDGTDSWEVYRAVLTALDTMRDTSMPYIIESDTLRMMGHAVYDPASYVTAQERAIMQEREPLAKTRKKLLEVSGYSDCDLSAIEKDIEQEIDAFIRETIVIARPDAANPPWNVYAPAIVSTAEPFKAAKVKNGAAVTKALDFILGKHPEAVLMGQDIGPYGSAFKTCKGLSEKYGPQRVIDMPVCESASIGFCLGASQIGARPIFEFQFSDFGSEAVTQLGLNSATWYFRSGSPAPILVRFPCGGGITLGAFHSGEYEGLWARFPGLKLVYPVTAQETFEALVAGYYDPNPVCVFEHKLMYWNKDGDIDFNGDLTSVFRPRKYRDGKDLTVVAFGAMVDNACIALDKSGYTADVWNPFILKPLVLEPIVESVKKTGRLCVVQESNTVAGLGDHIISGIVAAVFSSLKCAPRLVAPRDCPVPFARELESIHLPDTDTIKHALEEIMESGH